MIRITALYRNSPEARFDFDYYLKTHMKLSKDRLTDYGMLSYEVEKCLRTMNGDEPDYVCITHADFENMDGLSKGLDAHGNELMADISNYTNVDPEIEVCEVVAQTS